MTRVQRIERDVIVDQPEVVYSDSIFQSGQLVDYILGVVETLLALRFVLELFSANSNSWFVNAVYSITAPLMAPFNAVFHPTMTQGTTFEWSVLVAMVVYALLALALIRLIEIFLGRRYI